MGTNEIEMPIEVAQLLIEEMNDEYNDDRYQKLLIHAVIKYRDIFENEFSSLLPEDVVKEIRDISKEPLFVNATNEEIVLEIYGRRLAMYVKYLKEDKE